jgi:hypothetical protein
VGGGGALLVAGAGLFAWLGQDGKSSVAALPAAPSAASTALPAVPAPAPPTAAPAFNPVAALEEVLEGASPERRVTVQVGNSRVKIGRDRLGFSIRSSHAGYAYVYMVGTEGNDFHVLFPNAYDKDNRIRAGEVLVLPRAKWKFAASGPPGTDHFVVMVSDRPRDFSAAGIESGDPFSAFPFARAAVLQRDYRGKAPLFAGVPTCMDAPCPALYGAAAFKIDEFAE